VPRHIRIGKADIDVQTLGQLTLTVEPLYRKHAYSDSDESVCERCAQGESLLILLR
jgi:hypothetical protein